MKAFIVYDENGTILRSGIAPEETIELQAGDGEFVMEGSANDRVDKIDRQSNRVTRKEPHEIAPDPEDAEFGRIPAEFRK